LVRNLKKAVGKGGKQCVGIRKGNKSAQRTPVTSWGRNPPSAGGMKGTD